MDITNGSSIVPTFDDARILAESAAASGAVVVSGQYRTNTDYPVRDYFVGLDLGQAVDYTALSIVRETWGVKRADVAWQGFWREVELPDEDVIYDIVHLERFPLGTSYISIADQVKERIARLRAATEWQGSIKREWHRPRIVLAIDYTGVGRAVSDVFTDKGVHHIPVTITAGDKVRVVTEHGQTAIYIAKRELVLPLQVLLQQGRLKIAHGLPEGDILRQEMVSFRYKLSAAGNEQYGDWRSGKHDDELLSIATALAAARASAEARKRAAQSSEAVRRARHKLSAGGR